MHLNEPPPLLLSNERRLTSFQLQIRQVSFKSFLVKFEILIVLLWDL